MVFRGVWWSWVSLGKVGQTQARRRTARRHRGSAVLARFRSLLLAGLGLAVALLVSLPDRVVAQSAPAVSAILTQPELRGVWLTNIDSDVLFSEENLEHAIQRLTRLNFNTIYPTVWNSGYTLYPSPVAEKWTGEAIDPVPEFEDRDMLAEAIELGHAQGLAVIPWFEFGLMAPEDSELVRRHPDWVMSRKDGTQVFVHGEQGEHRFVWFNPAHPQVQEMLTDLVVEVVTQYNIDGVQFDDHFGTPIELGYDDYTVRLYQKEHGGRRPPDNIEDPEWMQWRASKVSTMMVKLFAAVKTRQPNCQISLSPNPKEFSYQKYLQDWASWVRLGFIDELVIQVYRTDQNSFSSELDRPEMAAIRRQVPVSIGILTGLRILPVATEQIQEQVQMTRDRKYAGFSFFFYGTLSDRDSALQNLLPQPASRPDIRNYATET